MMDAEPARGEIWYAELDPVRGHEQAGTRPCLIISVNRFNRGRAELVIVAPCTTRARGLASHVDVSPPEGGLTVRSYIKCEDLRSISKERLRQRVGSVSVLTMAQVEVRLRDLLGL
jgi:mRNA interferase MazF